MASNMWRAIEENCEICGEKLGERIIDDTGEPEFLEGCTIEDDDGYKLTVCERCLRLIVNKEWNGLTSQDIDY